tara:strand:- start:18 stop:332 length:315 start_codon:yes stop_codon:yes gene_type:complete
MGKILFNGIVRDMTVDEQKEYDAQMAIFAAEKPSRQLSQIRKIRNEKLSETDYLAMSDNTLSDDMKNFRKTMRNIPQDYDSSKYDELLARDNDGNLTHSVWSKP